MLELFNYGGFMLKQNLELQHKGPRWAQDEHNFFAKEGGNFLLENAKDPLLVYC